MLANRSRSDSLIVLTHHAKEQMCVRSIPMTAVEAVLAFGRYTHVRGADIYALGRKEVECHMALGLNLTRFEGVQVVCGTDGAVVTVYRNSDFRGLRPKRRHWGRRAAA